MNNEYYGAASTPTDDFLAHYGIKGMKWGVRKAIQKGNDRALRRQYKKAEKKLAKLEKLGSNGKKYAKRAAAYGAGAAVAGGLAAAGTENVARGMRAVGKGLHIGSSRVGLGGKGNAAHKALDSAANAVEKWGNVSREVNAGQKVHQGLSAVGLGSTGNKVHKYMDSKGVANMTISNNALARLGAGAVGAGLGIAAGRNAYRAATAKKHAAQAKEFRAEMNKAFAGTKYANGIPSKKKKNRR